MTRRKHFNPDQFSLQFSTTPKYNTGDDKVHMLEAHSTDNGQRLGHMIWDAQRGHIIRIKVNRDVARKGLGTEMWQTGHAIASHDPEVIAPKHSRDRTVAGELWARRVGGDLPPNKDERASELADQVQAAHPRGGRYYTQWDELSPVIRDTEDD